MAKSSIKTASVLAFERELSNSDALLSGGNWAERATSSQWAGIKLRTKDVRGTISNRLKNAIASDPAKLDAEIQKANLQRVDIAALPFDCDTLKVSFTLRVLGNLARRYAANIANGRFLWRNRVGAESVEVRVSHIENQQEKNLWIFNGEDFNLRAFATRQPKDKMDFYTLLDGWIIKDNIPAIDQQHYVIANLVRGGVFGDGSKAE